MLKEKLSKVLIAFIFSALGGLYAILFCYLLSLLNINFSFLDSFIFGFIGVLFSFIIQELIFQLNKLLLKSRLAVNEALSKKI